MVSMVLRGMMVGGGSNGRGGNVLRSTFMADLTRELFLLPLTCETLVALLRLEGNGNVTLERLTLVIGQLSVERYDEN